MLKPKYKNQKNYHQVGFAPELQETMPIEWLDRYPKVYVHKSLIVGDDVPIRVNHPELLAVQTDMGLDMQDLPKTFFYNDDDDLVLRGRVPEHHISRGGGNLYINLATPGMIAPDGITLGRTLYRQYLELAHYRHGNPRLSAREHARRMVASGVGALAGASALWFAELQQPTTLAAGAIIGGVITASVVDLAARKDQQNSSELTYLSTDPYEFSARMPSAIRYLAATQPR